MDTLPNAEPTKADEGRAARIAWEDRATEEAIKSAESDGTIPAEEIRAWVNSWGTPNELPMPQPRGATALGRIKPDVDCRPFASRRS